MNLWWLWTLLFTVGIASAFFWVRARSRQPSLQEKEPPRLVDAGGAQFYVEIQGRGPALVLLHGIGASSFTFRLIAQELASDFKVINVDLPGFGQSSKDLQADYGLDAQTYRLLELLDHLQVEQANLLGSSMGGALALWLARLAPDQFPKVLALAPATEPSRVRVSQALLKWVTPLAPHLYSKALLSQIYRRVVSSRDLITEETLQGYHRPYLDRKSAVTFLKATELLKDPRLPYELEGLKSKVRILYGARDRMVPQKDILQLTKVLPEATYFIHPTAGHHIHEDDPAWVIDHVRQFLLSDIFEPNQP